MLEEEKKVEAKTKEPERAVFYVDDVQKKFEERQQVLFDAFNKETNVANRYDIKVRIEELNAIFSSIVTLVK